MNVATHIREMRKEIAALRRRVSTLIMPGTAETNQGAKTRVRFDDEGADGKPFSSPFLHQASHSGKNGEGVSDFTRLGLGAPVYVLSPGGEIGEHSRILPAGPVGDHPAIGAAEQDGWVKQIGDAKFEIKNGGAKVTVGGSVFTIIAGEITVKSGKITLDGPVVMPKGFTAGDGEATGGTINGPLTTTKDITSQTKVAAPILQGALAGA